MHWSSLGLRQAPALLLSYSILSPKAIPPRPPIHSPPIHTNDFQQSASSPPLWAQVHIQLPIWFFQKPITLRVPKAILVIVPIYPAGSERKLRVVLNRLPSHFTLGQFLMSSWLTSKIFYLSYESFLPLPQLPCQYKLVVALTWTSGTASVGCPLPLWLLSCHSQPVTTAFSKYKSYHVSVLIKIQILPCLFPQFLR